MPIQQYLLDLIPILSKRGGDSEVGKDIMSIPLLRVLARWLIKRTFEEVHHHHQSVLPKGMSTANSGTYSEVLPKAGLPPQTQEPRA